MGNSSVCPGSRPVEDRGEDSEAQSAIKLYWACRTGNHQLTERLLREGANPNTLHPDDERAPVHVVVKKGFFKVLHALLEYGADLNLRTMTGETPLHCALRAAQNPKALWIRSRALQCLKMLLQNRTIELDVQDRIGGFTPIHLAVQFKLWDTVMEFIKLGANIDIEINGTTARKILEAENHELIKNMNIPEKSEFLNELLRDMFQDLKNKNQDSFIKKLEENTSGNVDLNSTDGVQTLLQFACDKGLTAVVKHLLQKGADPNKTSVDTRSPIILAAHRGHHEVLELFMQEEVTEVDFSTVDHAYWRRTALHKVTIAAHSEDRDRTSHARCLEMLLQQTGKIDVNAQDFRGNTALHYAAKSNRRDLVELLLNQKQKVNVFIKNVDNVPVFLDLSPQNLNDYLDECISVNGSSKSEKYYSLAMDYTFLLPPKNFNTQRCSLRTNGGWVSGGAAAGSQEEKELFFRRFEPAKQLEMEPLLMLSDSPTHRQLLKHPVITSFLHLKWHQVKFFFYINFLLYFFFTVFLSLHIHFLITSNMHASNGTNKESARIDFSPYEYDSTSPQNLFRWFAAILLIWPVIRESLQMVISVPHYFHNLENIMELALIILTFALLFVKTDHYTQQILAALAILFAYTELVLLIGKHPKFATYITMFMRVSRNFLGFFFLFSFLIFAFAFTFYVIFHDCTINNTCETRLFLDLGTSIFKTIVMLTGELEAENLQLDVFGYVIFVMFVLFIPICLLNLLTGLAVSDIAAIREEAVVDSCRAKVKLYSKIESILLGHPITNKRRFQHQSKGIISRLFDKKIRLLGNLLPENKLEVYLHQNNKMVPDVGTSRMPFTMSREEINAIVDNAFAIVSSRGCISETDQLLGKLEDLNAEMDSRFQALEKICESILQQLNNNAV